jgi:hypothetical protein
MSELKNKIIDYFMEVCEEYEYRITITTYEEIRVCPAKYINGEQTMSQEELQELLSKNLLVDGKRGEYTVKFANIDICFYETIWSKCSNKEEKEYFRKIFGSYMFQYDSPFENLCLFKNNEYQNDFIKMYYITKKDEYIGNNNGLRDIMKTLPKYNLHITKENLHLLCVKNKSFLTKIKNQATLKKYIENIKDIDITEFKQYWKKIDATLVSDKDFVTVGECVYIDFNKIILFNLNKDQGLQFYERRLKALSVLLNRKEFSEILNIERVILDGVQEMQPSYRFVIIGYKDQQFITKMMENIVCEVIGDTEDPDRKRLRIIVNNFLLNEQLTIKEDSAVKRPQRKI